jgi:tellurite methyltransferase
LSHETQNITPSRFVVEWMRAVAASVPEPKRALDIAMGRGRHALVLTRAAFKTFGVDKNAGAVREAAARASREGLRIHGWCADLTDFPLPRARFELVLVTRYLQRELFGSIRDALVPGGLVLYETFTVHQRALGTGPTSPDHLLAVGELRERFAGFEVVFYDEVVESEAVARLVARKP